MRLSHLNHGAAFALRQALHRAVKMQETMTSRDLTIAVVGSGGDGVMTLGDLLAQVAAKEGLHVIKTESYGPQIRGGEASCTVRVAAEEIFAPGDAVDVLVVFRWADFAHFRGEISVAP